MILRRFYDDPLAQASYLVGCAATGEALIVDPNRDVEQYITAAEREGLRVSHVTETHIHADFVSGSRELAQRTGARLFLSDEGDADWKYAFAEEDGATLLRDGDTFKVGNIEVRAMHTPGHTPEHLSFVITDTAGADRPMGVFTGDFVFVGDVGRPDLLERAAKYEGTMEAGARTLFGSLQKVKQALPDWVQIWPAHGAGSACGKSLGAVPQSTLGYEKLFNWGLAADDEEEFVQGVLAGQPAPPMYFAEMKRINKEGPAVRESFERPPHLPPSRLDQLLADDAIVVDTRSAAEYAQGHIPGTFNVPLGKSFTTWAGSVLPYDQPIYLLVGATGDEGTRAVDEAVRDLAMIGLDGVEGFFAGVALDQWRENGGEPEVVPQRDAEAVQAKLGTGAIEVIDVRNPSEWEAGHIPGSRNAPLGRLRENLDEIPRDRPLVMHCQSGARTAVGIGLLLANGFRNVAGLEGDFTDWQRVGRPVEKAPAEELVST